MFSEIIWSLVGIVWLIISIYIAYLVFKFGKPIFQSFLKSNGIGNISEINKVFQKFNHINKKK
jgi:hypothetical protein